MNGSEPYAGDNRLTYRTKPGNDPRDRAMADTEADRLLFGALPAPKSPLDSEPVKALHTRLMGHYLREIERQSAWRMRMERDEAFYDSDQWDPRDAQILKDRGQEPLVLNVIAQSLNWVIGSQRRARTDYKVVPRKKEASKAAQDKSHLLKYLADVNKSVFAMSDAFEEAVKSGLSWLECGVQDQAEGPPVYERYESWRNIVHDSSAKERDLADGRYIFRVKWMDPDDAIHLFPERRAQILASSSGSIDKGTAIDEFGDDAMDAGEIDAAQTGYAASEPGHHYRERIRMIEAWFKVPTTQRVMSGGQFSGEIYDPDSRGHTLSVRSGEAVVKERKLWRIHVMIMTPDCVLWFSESPYRHNRFPFTPLWCYRSGGTGEPYGIVRNMVDAQRDINKRFSRALAILSSNKTIMDEGAVPDLDEFEEEVARPNAIIVKRPGKDLRIDVDRDLAPAHLQVMQMSMQMIQTLSGVTDEAMGRTTNAVSGRAIMARQEQGVVSTATAFDHLRCARQYHGEKLLSLAEQFIEGELEFRVTNSRGQPDWVKINSGTDDDITATKADFIISEDDWNATLRQAQVTELMTMMTQLAPVAPQIVMVLLDLVVEAMDIPSREEVVKRIRQITGMEDPDADPNAPDPERQAREQQKAMQAELEQRAAMAQLAKLEGEAAKSMAVAEKEAAQAAKLLLSMPGETIEQKRRALELAVAMLTSPPGAVDTADALIAQGNGEAAPPPPQEAPPQAMQEPMPPDAMAEDPAMAGAPI